MPLIASLLVVLLAAGCSEGVPDAWLGAYRMNDGRLVSLRESPPDALRLRVFETGETRRYLPDDDGLWHAGEGLTPDALTGSTLTVEGGVLTLRHPDGAEASGQRDDHPVRDVEIESGDVLLHGRLGLPAGAGPHPAVVIAHGSGDDAATRTYGTPDFFPAHGIAVLVYDKRGTGRSSGTFTMSFYELAGDVASAAAWLAAQPEIDSDRIGVTGYSQGSWIGPLAASRSEHLSFVIANYGMIDSPRAEQRLESEDHYRRLGHDETAVAEAADLVDAAVDVIASGYWNWDRFDAAVTRYSGRPWMQDLEFPLTELVRWPHWVVRLVAPFFDLPGLPWDYDSLAALDTLAARGVPSAWLVASHDRSAPNAFTLAELERRHQAGEPVTLQVLAPTDHGFVLFEEAADGSRRYGNLHPEYFAAEVAHVRRLAGLDETDPLPGSDS